MLTRRKKTGKNHKTQQTKKSTNFILGGAQKPSISGIKKSQIFSKFKTVGFSIPQLSSSKVDEYQKMFLSYKLNFWEKEGLYFLADVDLKNYTQPSQPAFIIVKQRYNKMYDPGFNYDIVPGYFGWEEKDKLTNHV